MSETPSNPSDKQRPNEVGAEPAEGEDSSNPPRDETLEPGQPVELPSDAAPERDKKTTAGYRALRLVVIACGVLLTLVAAGLIIVFLRLQQLDTGDTFEQPLQDLSAQIQRLQSKLDNTQSQLDKKVQVLEQKNQALTSGVSQSEQKLKQQIDQVEGQVGAQLADTRQNMDMLQKRVDGHQQRILSLSTTNREDWLLAEAEYLLKLANQRIVLEKTAENALSVLEAADAVIAQVYEGTGDAELFAVRQALSRDIAALKLIQPVDREGVYLKLNALADVIEQLPRLPDRKTGVSTLGNQPTGQPETDNGLIASAWSEIKAELGQYFKIEDTTVPIKPLVDQHFTQLAGLNVRLLVEQAKLALLKESENIFEKSLQDAAALVTEYFPSSKAATKFVRSLEELSQVKVVSEMPDISQSLSLLNGYIRQRHDISGKEQEGQ